MLTVVGCVGCVDRTRVVGALVVVGCCWFWFVVVGCVDRSWLCWFLFVVLIVVGALVRWLLLVLFVGCCWFWFVVLVVLVVVCYVGFCWLC